MDEALLENLFDRSSYLYEEPENLLKQDYGSVFSQGKKCRYMIFSKSGFTRGLKESGKAGEVILLTLRDMMAA